MFHNMKYALLFLFVLSLSCCFAQQAVDTLHLVKTTPKKTKEAMILPGDLIIIYSAGLSKNKGTFDHISGDSIVVNVSDDNQKQIAINDIKKIKTLKSGGKRFLGATVKLIGYFGYSLTGLTLATSIASMNTNNIYGALLIFAVVPVGAASYGVVVLGDHIRGKKYKLNKKWEVEPLPTIP